MESIETFTIRRNVESIRAIPETHIAAETRQRLLDRAAAGEDVYAYGLERIESKAGTANLWDTDTRIPLYPIVERVWTLQHHGHLTNDPVHRWLCYFNNGQPLSIKVAVIIIPRQAYSAPGTMTTEEYLAYVVRRIMGLEATINTFHHDPADFNGNHV